MSACFCSTDNDVDSLLKKLDVIIDKRKIYSDRKESKIDEINNLLSTTVEDQLRFDLYGNLFREYSNYQTDFAHKAALKRIEIAKKIDQPHEIAVSQMNMAEVLKTAGMFKETLDILEDLRTDGLYKEDLKYYYHLYHSLYLLMIDYSLSENERTKYKELAFNYKDSILLVSKLEGFSYYTIQSGKKISQGKFDEALALAQKSEAMASAADYNEGIINHVLSAIYHHKGDSQKEKYYLTKSAIADLQSGVKEYISLHSLALILYNEGDLDRAYLYVKCAMEDAIFCNAPLRTLEVSRMLPIINSTYDAKMQSEQKRLYGILIVVVILALILMITLFYTYKQVKKLSSIRKHQKKTNLELKSMNTDLNMLNSKLLDSDMVKEEYIGQMFNLCSTYIDKLEDFRIAVNRKIKAGQIDELRKSTSSSSLVDKELKEFYKNFDTIFLNIYPTFRQEFNTLLKPDAQITIKEDGDLLTTELRIFALVRLGINDSVKIAELLHYSPQTIYNYRQKIRNNLSVSREQFKEELMKIGRKKL
ncbi:hypothetical protein D0T56_02085 [Dysgonomonas sp. 520]|nr:hypothetical protein [Dysgonomonas sp. 520]